MIGQTLNNRYKITSRLGKGAMGTVYRATDTQSGRDVALKIIASDLVVDPEMLERFKREGEALSKLKHPNIVEFLDAFEYEEQYVIVMEYISGGSLHELISKGPLPIEHANRIALEVCDALIRSHHLNIIHRDLKPENILLTEDGTPKLADFGVARLSEGTRMTRSGTQVGTPYYMAPEAWEGKNLDAQADIWSLGVVLFEMLTGQVPFGGDTGAAVMNKVLTTQPPNLKTLRNEAPSGMVKIVSRMLARDKKRRYQTMREIAVDLERGQQASTGLPAKKVKPARWLPALISLGLVLAISAIWLWTKSQGEQPALPVADSTNTPRPTATIIRTVAPTSTLTPIEQGEWLELCGSDLCWVNHSGDRTSVGLVGSFTNIGGWGGSGSASPNGDRVVFSACLREYVVQNPDDPFCLRIFVANRDGSNAIPLVDSPRDTQTDPSWSPDGEWIAYGGWGLALSNPDGTSDTTLLGDNAVGNVHSIAWSPDSQRLAYVSGGADSAEGWGFWNELYVFNRDGSDWRLIFNLPDAEPNSDDLITELAWSPDGQLVAFEFGDGRAYLIDADCEAGASGCTLPDLTKLPEIPEHWLPNFYPQWAGEFDAPTPTAAPASAGEAFAAPILAAIADLPPDFEDDFSTDKGWRDARGWTTPSIQDGQLYLQVGANIDWITMLNPEVKYHNFVMMVDGAVKEFAGNNTQVAISWGAWGDSPGNTMNFGITAIQTWTSSWCGPTNPTCPDIYESGPVRLEKDIPIKLMIIARGDEWAVYVDGALLSYVNDPANSVSDDFIALRGWADAETRSAVITYDNFKIWNLENVPGLP